MEYMEARMQDLYDMWDHQVEEQIVLGVWPYGFAAYPQYDDHRHVVTFWAFSKIFDQPTFGM